MRNNLSISAGLAILAFNVILGSAETLLRENPFCGYMGGHIYCYGGEYLVPNGILADTNLYSLNITQLFGQPTESMHDKWELIKPSTPFNTESRRMPSAIVLPDGKKFLIQGGSNLNKTKYVNQTIVYDTTTNTWQSGSPYTERERGIRQLSYASTVLLPNNLVGFYGGIDELANTSIPQITASGAVMPFNNATSFVGFSNIQTYSPETKIWAPLSPQINAPANYYPNFQTATLDPASGKVYYLGGEYHTPTAAGIAVGFSWAYTFNTKSATWLNEALGGAAPSIRTHHTANLLPNSRDIIVYGGACEHFLPCLDYCFTLNLVDNTWTNQSNVKFPKVLSGPRFTHSSVIVNNTLFILFGKGLDGTLQSRLLSIDVANVSKISYTPIFAASSDAKVSPTINNTIYDPSLPVLSKGAIGGIVAGVVVAVLAIGAFYAYCLRKKRKSKQMDLDWDKIDEQYKEMYPVSAEDTAHLANFVNATTKEKSSPPNSKTQYKPNARIMNDIENDYQEQRQIDTQNPNSFVMDTVKPSIAVDLTKPSVDSVDRGHAVVKPDEN